MAMVSLIFFATEGSMICRILINDLRTGFNWEALSENDLVVDVGGGIGTVSIQVAEKHPKLKFVVQDRAPVIADGVKVVVFHRSKCRV